MRASPILALLIALAACNRAGEGARGKDGAAMTSERWGGVFAALPGARKLCSQHVTGVDMHIEWTSYATDAPLAEVVAFYEKNALGAAIERDGGFRLRAPRDRVLSVHEKGGVYPRCETAPSAGEATVIIVSQAIR